jgi:hypothetical protein
VQITDGGWDHHAKLRDSLPVRCKAVDKPIAGRGSPTSKAAACSTIRCRSGAAHPAGTLFDQHRSQGKAPASDRGREHNPRGFTMFLALRWH